MPFSGYRQPSLALGILKSVLRPLVSHVAVLDATLIFVEMISPTAYDTIATWPAQDLLGDWVFAHARSPERGQEDRGYEQQVLAGGAPEHRVAHFGKPPVSTHLRAQLRDAQRRVDDFLSVCLDEITRSEPDIVGFTAMFHQLSASLALAQRVKTALPASCLVMGGASCPARWARSCSGVSRSWTKWRAEKGKTLSPTRQKARKPAALHLEDESGPRQRHWQATSTLPG